MCFACLLALGLGQDVRESMSLCVNKQVLVDVRRAVSYVRTEGKREQYTAMVAVGNMNVSYDKNLVFL